MTSAHVVFRIDSGSTIGMGHLMRCLTLAKALKRQRMRVLFLCEDQTSKALKQYGPQISFHVIPDELSPTQDAHYCYNLLESLANPPDWLIVDHYTLGKQWEQTIRPCAKHLMAIDDLGRSHDCDLLLDANFTLVGKQRYQGRVPNNCHLLLGPRYALLREGFKTARKTIKVGHSAIPRIFLCFGGADPQNMTFTTATTLAHLAMPFILDIVVGYGYKDKKKLERLCQDQRHWRLHIDHAHPEKLMAKADLAIGAGGTMMWERCAVGLPSIVISIADNQREASQKMGEKGIICYLGHYDTIDETVLYKTVMHLLNEKKDRNRMRTLSKKLVDVHGTERIIRKMYGA